MNKTIGMVLNSWKDEIEVPEKKKGLREPGEGGRKWAIGSGGPQKQNIWDILKGGGWAHCAYFQHRRATNISCPYYPSSCPEQDWHLAGALAFIPQHTHSLQLMDSSWASRS